MTSPLSPSQTSSSSGGEASSQGYDWTEIELFGKVLFDFNSSGPYQLNLRCGQMVHMSKIANGWYKGFIIDQPNEHGLFPVSYIEVIQSQEQTNNISNITISSPTKSPMSSDNENNNSVMDSPISPSVGRKSSSHTRSKSASSVNHRGRTVIPPPVKNVTRHASPPPLPSSKSPPTPSKSVNDKTHSPPAITSEHRIPPPIFSSTNTSTSNTSPPPITYKYARKSTLRNGSAARRSELSAPQADIDTRSLSTADVTDDCSSTLKSNISLEALLAEIAITVRDWSTEVVELMNSGQLTDYYSAQERILALLELRRRVHDPSIDEQQRLAARQEVVELIESSRKMSEGYMVPRNGQGQVADSKNTGIIELLHLHRTMYSGLKEANTHIVIEKTRKRQQNAIRKQQRRIQPTNNQTKENMNNTISDPITPMANVFYPPGPLQLFVDVKMCIFSVGEATVLHFSLFSNTRNQFMTERYSLSLTDQGMPVNLKLLGQMRALFTDLNAHEMQDDVWLCCHIYRRGGLGTNDKKKSKTITDPDQLHLQPFGCACLQLNQPSLSLHTNINTEVQPANSAMTIYTARDQNDFARIHQLIIQKDIKSITEAPRAKGIALGLTLFTSSLSSVEEKQSELLTYAVRARKLYFESAPKPSNLRNDFYINIWSASFLAEIKKNSRRYVSYSVRIQSSSGQTVSNVLYPAGNDEPVSEYRSAVYQSSTPNFNDTLRINLTEEQFEHCHALITFWSVQTNSKQNRPFAFVFLPLTDRDGSVINNGKYVLPVYKPFSGIENPTTANYLGHEQNVNDMMLTPSKTVIKDSVTLFTSLTSTIKTSNSIIHSILKWQKQDSSSLIVHLNAFQNKISKGQLDELARYVRILFNALFAIISSSQHKPAHLTAFLALLHMISLLTDRKLPQYRPLLEQYASTELFNDRAAYQILLEFSSKQLYEQLQTPDSNLVQLSKCMTFVMQFIVSSRQNDVRTNHPHVDHQTFLQRLRDLLQTINKVITMSEEKDIQIRARYVLASQSYLIRSFPDTLPHLFKCFNSAEMADIVGNLINSIPDVSTHQLNKLNLLRQLVIIERLMSTIEIRQRILPIVIDRLALHLRTIDNGILTEAYLCIATLTKMLSFLDLSDYSEEVVWPLHSLLPNLLHLISTLQRQSQGEITLKPPSDTATASCKVDIFVDSCSCLYTILNAMNNQQLTRFLDLFNVEQLRPLVHDILYVIRYSLQHSLFPEIWIVLNMLQLQLNSRLLCCLHEPLLNHLWRDSSYDGDIWAKYLDTVLMLSVHDNLRLEHFNERRQQFIHTRYGDIRLQLLQHFRQLWSQLSSHKLDLACLIERLLEIVHRNDPITSSFAIDIYFDLLSTEFNQTTNKIISSNISTISSGEHFRNVEQYTIDALYHLANISSSDKVNHRPAFFPLFSKHLTNKLSNAATELRECVQAFIQHVGRLYELMWSLLQLPDTALFEDERTQVALKLMNYLKSTGNGRKEMFARYSQYLVHLHVNLKNWIEAALTTIQLAEQYNFNEQLKILPAFNLHSTHHINNSQTIQQTKHSITTRNSSIGNNPVFVLPASFPSEYECHRKERLYISALELFCLGEDWERAIEFSRKLGNYYENINYNYDALSKLLKQQSDYFQHIAHSERFYSNYFRVAFYGNDWSNDIKDKQFIYRGVKLESMSDFTFRLKKKWPNAKLLNTTEQPNSEQLSQHQQQMSICVVKRCEQEELNNFTENEQNQTNQHLTTQINDSQQLSHDRPPAPVIKYRENNEISAFTYSRAVTKTPESSTSTTTNKNDNEFANLWITKHLLLLNSSFPSCSRRIQVISHRTIQLSPIDAAIETIHKKNIELENVLLQTRESLLINSQTSSKLINNLSMLLNGMIDAAVNGGTQKYLDAFLDTTQQTSSSTTIPINKRKQLQKLLRHQLDCLEKGLQLFGEKCDEQLRALYQHLTKQFQSIRTKTANILRE